MKDEKLIVVEESDPSIFESKCNMYLKKEYILSSSSCGFANSEKYDFCSSYQAILIKKND